MCYMVLCTCTPILSLKSINLGNRHFSISSTEPSTANMRLLHDRSMCPEATYLVDGVLELRQPLCQVPTLRSLSSTLWVSPEPGLSRRTQNFPQPAAPAPHRWPPGKAASPKSAHLQTRCPGPGAAWRRRAAGQCRPQENQEGTVRPLPGPETAGPSAPGGKGLATSAWSSGAEAPAAEAPEDPVDIAFPKPRLLAAGASAAPREVPATAWQR